MKTFIIAITLVLTINTANAQLLNEPKVPLKVRESFTKQFPDVKKESWKKNGGNYEAEFEVNNTASSAIYDGNGIFIEAETELNKSDLPKSVTDYITEHLNGKKVREAAVVTDSYGKVRYKAEIGREEYIFDSDCSFVRKEGENQRSN